MLYSSDELIFKIMSFSLKPKSLNYAYTWEEIKTKYSGLIDELDGIISSLLVSSKTNANVTFAIVASQSPFQVIHVAENDFAILIGDRTFDTLISLCVRIQSLEGINDMVGAPNIKEPKQFSGKYLLDITKEIVFHTKDPAYLMLPTQPKYVYRAALCFIVSHEFAHISHGHLEFKKSEVFPQYAQTEDEHATTLRTLEMDADASATSSVFAIFENNIESMKQLEEIPPNLEKSIRAGYILGIYIAHIYHDSLTLNYTPKRYPTGYSRFMTSVSVIQQLYSKNFPEQLGLPEETRRSLTQAFVNLSGHLNNLWHPIVANSQVYDIQNHSVSHEYNTLGEVIALDSLEPLHDRWALIRPELEKFRRGGSLAPAITRV
ncbi:hypothetical protein P2C08_20460 [Xanthomonas perforans]|uniref:hypothetical protein n=1 Tax=Xanthomonas TaxID=338 RepID=UPI0011B2298D|nr:MULTISPECIES: hypothetical protein [Xanthomonas]WOP47183.1 hypothetical protein R2B60_15685 [Xanthomonas euvesicatoria]WOP53403.1 hypothetical protein R5576_05700 [Xanthomonas euvesicatoria]